MVRSPPQVPAKLRAGTRFPSEVRAASASEPFDSRLPAVALELPCPVRVSWIWPRPSADGYGEPTFAGGRGVKEYVVVKDAETGKTRLLVREVKSPVAAPAGSLRAMPVGKRFRMAGALCWLAGLKIESRDRVDNLRNLSFKLFFLFAIGIPFGGLFAGVGMASYKPEERNHFFLVASTIVLSLVAVTIVARALLRRILLKRLPQVAEPARSRPQGPYRTSLTPEPRDKP